MGASQCSPFLSPARGWGCPGVRKRRREGRRKPLLCVLFLVRKMKWLLGANKWPFENCFFFSYSRRPPSLLFPPPPPAPASRAPVCGNAGHGDKGDTRRNAHNADVRTTQRHSLAQHTHTHTQPTSVRDGTLYDRDSPRRLRRFWPIQD